MEKSKPTKIKPQARWGCRTILKVGAIGIAIYLSPLICLFLTGMLLPWTLIPPVYPNATVISTEVLQNVDCCADSIILLYCTDASLDELKTFFVPIVGEFRAHTNPHEYTHYASKGVETSFTELLPYHVYWSVDLAIEHPACARGAIYQVYVSLS